MSSNSWICCQLGAREHYAIPRSLHRYQNLHCFITDAWIGSRSPLRRLRHRTLQSLQERFHPDLADACIHHRTLQCLSLELRYRLQQADPWLSVMARNQWFQRQGCNALKIIASGTEMGGDRPVLFAYSYAALEILRFAKQQGWYTVMGQIDPGILEETIVRKEYQRRPTLAPEAAFPPASYWNQWQDECDLADQIVVNSVWSKLALENLGIPSSKLQVIPLAYEPSPLSQTFDRTYPEVFTSDRPLRVLFLGQVILRKGIAALLEAARLLGDRPVEFWIVGQLGIQPPTDAPQNLRWLGAVPRSQVVNYYQSADVFLFPTLSDGFGLTQLEAQAWKLPIIASRFCGEVVKDQTNGLLLPEVSGEAIADALCTCLQHPEKLQQWANQSIHLHHFSLDQLHHRLQTLTLAAV